MIAKYFVQLIYMTIAIANANAEPEANTKQKYFKKAKLFTCS